LVFGRLWQSTGRRDVIAALLAKRGFDFDFDVERARSCCRAFTAANSRSCPVFQELPPIATQP
jgi:hypothetical protein